ncbi:MAG: T9SS type A sorting domain-containing protein [Bacteroidetes bacterium]|nr:T9SS type A sorting domain-containing protein [Bacteroidota bacterium]
MKKYLLTLLPFLLCSIACLATDVYGIISVNTTWTKANSPYRIIGDLRLDSNVTLTIEPGTEIRGKANRNFFIYGEIIAKGTITDSIRFTQDSVIQGQFGWEGLSIRDPHPLDTFTFEYCHFQYAHYAISTINHIKVTNCLFTNNTQGIRTVYNSVYVSDCLFMNNEYGVLSDAGGHLRVQNCGFVNNANTMYGGHLNFNNNMVFNANNAINGGVDTITNNLFVNSSNYTILGSFRYLANNKIWQSKTGINYFGGIAEHNTIKYCNTAIYLSTGVNNNAIRNNCISYSAKYNIDGRQTAQNSDVSNNYWGLTDSAKIDSLIFDYNDTLLFSVGFVNFMPILQSADQSCVDTFSFPSYYPFPLSIPKIENDKVLTVYPNPATDVVTIETGNQHTIKKVTLYTLTGLVMQQIEANTSKLTLNIASIPNGMYLVKVFTNDGKAQVTKLLKE